MPEDEPPDTLLITGSLGGEERVSCWKPRTNLTGELAVFQDPSDPFMQQRPEAFKKFEHIQCRTSSVVLLAIFMFFFFRYAIDTIEIILETIFASSAYLFILLSIIPHALLIMVVVAFAKIEKRDLTIQTLGLSLQISKESKMFIFLFLITGVGILAFYSYMKFQGIDIHLIHPNPALIPWTEKADWDEKLCTIVLFIIPYSVRALLIAPFVEEAYFTGLIFPVLRNRLGFIFGFTLTAFLFSYHHYSPFSEGQLTAFIIMFMTQSLSFFLYQFTHSLYPSIVYHSLRNMSVLSLELSAFI